MSESIAAVGEDQKPDLPGQKPAFWSFEAPSWGKMHVLLQPDVQKSDWLNSFAYYAWVMPNNIKKQCQTYQIVNFRFSVSFYRDPSYSAVPDVQILVFECEDLVSGFLRQRQSIRTHERGPTWNLYVSSMRLKNTLFFCADGNESALWSPRLLRRLSYGQ